MFEKSKYWRFVLQNKSRLIFVSLLEPEFFLFFFGVVGNISFLFSISLYENLIALKLMVNYYIFWHIPPEFFLSFHSK